jgi:phosphopantothenoylcysteine synthetase/decarboxylase
LEVLKNAIQMKQKYEASIIYLPFKTIHYYLHMTLAIRDQLPAGSIYILCAAVSDFLPKQTPSHKIHTSDRLEL